MNTHSSPAFTIRPMREQDMAFAIDCAAAEGWNPGINDAACFYAADREGFLIGELNGKPIGCISAVSYGTFGFIGLYIIVPEQRGKGYGIQLWRHAMTRLAAHNIGLDGVEAQQDNYARAGFQYAYGNTRYEGNSSNTPPAAAVPNNSETSGKITTANTVPFTALCAYDNRFFPAPRENFLRAWLAQTDARAIVWQTHQNIGGFAVMRPCRHGYKIGPLFADSPAIAAALLAHLCAALPPDSTFYLDVPNPNTDAIALATTCNMQPVFTTARMYTKQAPPLARGVFGVTTFELG